MDNVKKCSKCGRELPLECFNKNKSKKDGLNDWCKECRKQYDAEHAYEIKQYKKQYRVEHKEEIAEYFKQWRAEHADEIAEYFKQYYQANREDILEKNKQYRAEHVDEIKQYQAEHYATIEYYAYIVRRNNLRNDIKYGRCGKDEDPLPPLEYYIEKFSEGIDYYDGKKYPFNELGFDRIDDNLPHTIDNMVVATTFHNVDRWHKRMSVEEYKAYIQNEELTLACG